MHTPWWLVGTLMAMACGIGPVAGEGPDPGATARVVLSVSGGIGGLADTTVIDSASATLVRTSCLAVRGVPNSCTGGLREWRVSLSGPEVDSLFSATQTPEFRALAAEYDMSGTYVDGPAYNLRITLSSRTRSIRWSDVPSIPNTLTQFVMKIQERTAEH